MIPGELFVEAGDLHGPDVETVDVTVRSRSDRAIQVTSHFHFFEVNRELEFDREAAYGRRLDVPAGTAVRFAPGETHVVRLRPFAGRRVALGFNGLVDGPLDDPAVRERAFARARERGFVTSDGSA